MPLLNSAAAIYLGDRAVDRVYRGSVQVWPPSAPDLVEDWFGTKLTNGGGNWGLSANRAMLDRFTLTHNAQLTGLFVWILAGAQAGGHIKGIICADNAGLPGAVLVMGAAAAVPAGGPFYVESPMSGNLPPGDYWIGAVSDGGSGPSGEMGSGAHTAPQSAIINGDFSYASPPPTCPAPAARYNNDLGVYVEYLRPA